MTLPPDASKLKLAILRSEALFNFYRAERRAGVDPLTANENMADYADRMDALFESNQAAVKTEMERT